MTKYGVAGTALTFRLFVVDGVETYDHGGRAFTSARTGPQDDEGDAGASRARLRQCTNNATRRAANRSTSRCSHKPSGGNDGPDGSKVRIRS